MRDPFANLERPGCFFCGIAHLSSETRSTANAVRAAYELGGGDNRGDEAKEGAEKGAAGNGWRPNCFASSNNST